MTELIKTCKPEKESYLINMYHAKMGSGCSELLSTQEDF